MPSYRRHYMIGKTDFITQVMYERERCLGGDVGRTAIREAIGTIRQKYPFTIDAFVSLPDHFNCLWMLPPNDGDFSVRL